MSMMSKVYGEIEDLYKRGMAPHMIALDLKVPVSLVEECIEAWGDDWDDERWDYGSTAFDFETMYG